MDKDESENTGDQERAGRLRKVLPDFAAFAGGLGLAWFLEWKTADLVWSLWLSSLVIGYATILSTIVGGVLFGIRAFGQSDDIGMSKGAAALIGIGGATFFLGFFSLHFCGFHAGHAAFLSSFFPLDGLPKNVFGEAFMNPFLLWKTAILYLVPSYGLFLVPMLIAERKHVFSMLVKGWRAGTETEEGAALKTLFKPSGAKKAGVDNPFSRPYINVIRMHMLIFFFAGCEMLKIESFLVCAVVYTVYFFPWREMFGKSKDKATTVELDG